MTFYEKEVLRIKKNRHSNQWQIDMIIKTKRYIDHNFEQDLNLDALANKFFISKYHLLRLFKRYYGQTPKQYLIERRMEKSKGFLIAGMSATETCFAVGFESPGSFSSLFKRKIGKSPSKFQKEQL